MYQALHPRLNGDRLYVSCNEGGKGLHSLEECVNAEKRSLGQYLKMNKYEWVRSAWEEDLIKEDEDPKEYREKISKSRMEEWQSKPKHGQFLRQTKDLSSNDYYYYYYQTDCKPQLIEQNAINPKAPAGKAIPRRKKINKNEGKKR